MKNEMEDKREEPKKGEEVTSRLFGYDCQADRSRQKCEFAQPTSFVVNDPRCLRGEGSLIVHFYE
jgi:hypothetical protein